MIKLFSEQGHDLRNFKSRIDRQRSPYAKIPRIADTIAELYQRLSTDQVIWCLLDAPESGAFKTQYLHTIEYDERDKVVILNGLIWEHLLGQNCIPEVECARIRHQCCLMKGSDRDKEMQRLKDEYLKVHLPPGDPWDKLIADDLNCLMPQVLLCWPLLHSRIVCVTQAEGGAGDTA